MEYLVKVRTMPVGEKISTVLNMPYPADPLVEPEFVGLTFSEVAILKQAFLAAVHGSKDALDFLLDRSIGKPQTKNLNVNVNGTYQDFLNQIAENEEGIINVVGRAQREADQIS